MRAMEGSYVLGCVQPCKPQNYSRCPQDYKGIIAINTAISFEICEIIALYIRMRVDAGEVRQLKAKEKLS